MTPHKLDFQRFVETPRPRHHHAAAAAARVSKFPDDDSVRSFSREPLSPSIPRVYRNARRPRRAADDTPFVSRDSRFNIIKPYTFSAVYCSAIVCERRVGTSDRRGQIFLFSSRLPPPRLPCPYVMWVVTGRRPERKIILSSENHSVTHFYSFIFFFFKLSVRFITLHLHYHLNELWTRNDDATALLSVRCVCYRTYTRKIRLLFFMRRRQ